MLSAGPRTLVEVSYGAGAQVGAAVGLLSQYTRVAKLYGPCRAIAACMLSAFTDASLVE